MSTFHKVITRYIIQSSRRDSSNGVAFLHSKISPLAPTDHIVNIKHDDIYVNPKVQ